MPARSCVGMTVRLGTGERGRTPFEWPPNGVRGEQGGAPGGCPRGPLSGSLRKSGGDARQGTDLPGDARSGRLGSRVSSGLKFDVRMRFRFPRKVSLPLSANLRDVFPRRTPIGRLSVIEGHSRPNSSLLSALCQPTPVHPLFRFRNLQSEISNLECRRGWQGRRDRQSAIYNLESGMP